MNKKICLLFSLIIFFTVMCVTQLEAGWTYKRPIAVTNTTGSSLTDYQVLVTLTTANTNSYAGMVEGEIRFAVSDASDPLPYWIENWDTSGDSKIWVKVPTIDTGTTTPFNMYYVNSNATDASDGETTFEFFDDFPGTTLDSDKWTEDAVNDITHTINNYFRFEDATKSVNNYWVYDGTDTGSQHQSTWTPTSSFIIDWHSKIYDTVANPEGQMGQGGIAIVTTDNTIIYYVEHEDEYGTDLIITRRVRNENGSAYFLECPEDQMTDEVNYTIIRNGNNYEAKINGASVDTYSSASTVSRIAITAGAFGDYSYLDYVEMTKLRVRKYTSPEPTASVGSETGPSDYSLPVELSVFTAQYLNNIPTLYWQTQSETNNAGWNIYRGESNEALSNEETYQLNLSLGLIPGAGTTSEPTEYSFEDLFPVYAGNTYFYWLESVDYSGESESYGPISLVIPAEEWQNPNSPEIPKPYGLHQNYPNPFNPNTEISFMMKENCIGELSIYNIKGQKIKTIFSDLSIPKDELIICNWEGKDESGKEVSTGVYYYKLRTTKENFVRKMILLK